MSARHYVGIYIAAKNWGQRKWTHTHKRVEITWLGCSDTQLLSCDTKTAI